MDTKKQERLKLSSMAPLDDGGRKYNIIYIVAVALGVIIGICLHNGIEGILGVNFLTLLMALTIKHCILDLKWKGLRLQKFYLDNKVPYDALIHHLIGQLTPLNFRVEKGSEENPVITHKKMIYDVTYGEDDSFTIWWRKSIVGAFFDFRTSIYHYRNTVVDMGIIGYTVQQICCENMANNMQKNAMYGSEACSTSTMPTNSEISTDQVNSNNVNQYLSRGKQTINIQNRKKCLGIGAGIVMLLLIILGSLSWLGNISDNEKVVEKNCTEDGYDEEIVKETVFTNEDYDEEDYSIEDMDEVLSYGLNESVIFELEDGGQISVIFTECGSRNDTAYISYVIQNIGSIPVMVGESMFSVYANDYIADLDYGANTVYEETISVGRKVSGQLYPRITMEQVRKLEIECGDVTFLLRDTSAVDAMLGTYYRQYKKDGDNVIDEIQLYRSEYNNGGLAISAKHHIDYGNGFDFDRDSNFSSWNCELYDDRIEFHSYLYSVEGLVIYYSNNAAREGIYVAQFDSASTEDIFTGNYEWTDNIQVVYESAKNAKEEKESILLNDLYINTVFASSELMDSAGTYTAEALFDGDRDTCWAEGVDGDGEGQYIEIYFSTPIYLTDIFLLNGYMKNEDVFNNNGKIDRVEFAFSDGYSFEMQLDEYTYQDIVEQSYSDWLKYDSPIYTEYLKITILEASSGEKYDDICLSELEVWGYADSE
ncbi:MAG: hypothetical protein HDR05_05180 [Lachnospiraceae bacterium]|nr:hypothetical protein [Lachnospiraceae bacterium]